jgi:hypothetical protein
MSSAPPVDKTAHPTTAIGSRGQRTEYENQGTIKGSEEVICAGDGAHVNGKNAGLLHL